MDNDFEEACEKLNQIEAFVFGILKKKNPEAYQLMLEKREGLCNG